MQAAAKKEQHTRGEWTFEAGQDEIRAPWRHDFRPEQSDLMADYRGAVIASIAGAHGGRNGRDHAVPEAEANARIISAAPELLEACQQLLQIVRLQNGNKYADINQICDDANYAISKALGE